MQRQVAAPELRHHLLAAPRQVRLHAAAHALQPVLLEPGHQCALARVAEGVDVTVAGPDKVFERDGQLEGAGYRAQEFLLIDVHEPVEVAHGRDGRLTDADGGDLGRFDQRDLDLVFQLICQRARRYPPRRAAAGNDHLAYSVGTHVYLSPI